MSSNKVVKSPTLVAVAPTLVLVPFVLMRTWRRSGKLGAVTVLVQNVNCVPFCKKSGGVSNQLLRVDTPDPELKLTPM